MRIHHNNTAPDRRSKARMVLAGLLVLALLWTQSMGLWHRLVHFETAYTSDTARTPAGPTNKLFSNHHSAADCQLFDQLSHADGVATAAVVALGAAVLPQFLRASHGLAVARWHALFQARGPPSVR